MYLHGMIEKVEEFAVELEHELAADARKAWELFKAELEKLRYHAHPNTGMMPLPATPVLTRTGAPESQSAPVATSGAAPAEDTLSGVSSGGPGGV